MGRAGRLKGQFLFLRARVPTYCPAPSPPADRTALVEVAAQIADTTAIALAQGALHKSASNRIWAVACSEVLSICYPSVKPYLEPIKHKIKFSRDDCWAI